MAFEGIQPTLRHVPPKVPRFSTQAVWQKWDVSERMTKLIAQSDAPEGLVEQL